MYVEQFGFTDEHIPELIRLAIDPDLNTLDSDRPEVWAPLHAWYTLGQLQAEVAIAPLIGLFVTDDEFVYDNMPTVFGLIGGAAIPALARYLNDATQAVWPLTTAADCLREIAANHPAHREAAIAPLLQRLEQYANNDPNLNSTLVQNLTSLKAVEAAPLIERAFATEEIDELLTGTWAQVQIDLGLKTKQDFSPEDLKPKIPAGFAEMQETIGNISKMLHVMERRTSKPAGFGQPSIAKAKKPKQKKKK